MINFQMCKKKQKKKTTTLKSKLKCFKIIFSAGDATVRLWPFMNVDDVNEVAPIVLPQEGKENENGRQALSRDVTALDWNVSFLLFLLDRKEGKKEGRVGRTDGRTKGRTKGRTNERTKGRTNEGRDERTNEGTNEGT